jgi:antitoxin ParD1/3/4
MAAKYHRHVALTEPLARFIDQQVTEGRYASASEVVRAALRLLERQEVGAQAAKVEGDANA